MSRNTTLDKLILEHPLWKNPRTFTALSTKELRELGEDMTDRGQVTPLLVQSVLVDGLVVDLVLDGQRRCMALELIAKERKKGLGTVVVKVDDLRVTEGDPTIDLTQEVADQLTLDVVAAMKHRAGLSSYEEVEVAISLHLRKMDQTEIAKALDRSESWVSRMLRAYKLSSPLLLEAWKKGKVTDEVYKDLADIQPHEKQETALGKALGLREQGGREAKAEARNTVKEAKAEAKAEREKAKPTSRANKPTKPAKSSSRPMLKEILELTVAKRPSDPYVKGVTHGVAYALGEIGVDAFNPAWRTYLKGAAKSGAITPEGLGGMQLAAKKAKTKKAGKAKSKR